MVGSRIHWKRQFELVSANPSDIDVNTLSKEEMMFYTSKNLSLRIDLIAKTLSDKLDSEWEERHNPPKQVDSITLRRLKIRNSKY